MTFSKRPATLLYLKTTMKRLLYSAIIICCTFLSGHAQLLKPQSNFSLADSLRGMLTPLRTCYDINYYHLDVKIDIDQKSISGSNTFNFTAVSDFSRLQFDLFSNLNIDKIVYKGQKLPYKREFNAVFVTFPGMVKKGTKASFEVYYSGKPVIAVKPPWDGGFIFSKDIAGAPFVSVACEGLGASSWWPNKDHLSDEADSMLISISVPKALKEISNGRLRSIKDQPDGYRQYNWFVSNPINNYDVTFYIGNYAHWTDQYKGEDGELSLDFWSLKEDSLAARPHWDADVKRMLKSFEHWFGPYPFYKDGYKLVQAPHLGMEHQSAVAYGNKFKMGYLGRDLSGTGWGLKFDFITVHESGHEWFGNSITAKDIGDMWIHESFTNYSEPLFVESEYGKEASSAYVQGIRKIIRNDIPIIGPYNVNKEGSGDMYPKGANMIHTIRQIINDDEKFRSVLRGLSKTFYHQTVTTAQVEKYMSEKSGLTLDKVFDQYLRTTKIPVLSYQIAGGKLSYRWDNVVEGFEMPVKVTLKPGAFTFIYPTSQWKEAGVTEITADTFKADPNFYIELKMK
ncbi:M1 family metallopeptidase [Pedobacter hartonius]|uniref:Peptidase family M1 n=1 Tax=Pedobacter hartonius TaxID=425514 RepID=A0A1H4ESG0_9SPHI|nr:M1 family metallopeptidase [Pedobacter hartonius]SEA87971.1 Peptidase family M1 [Pedobacter hartonius]